MPKFTKEEVLQYYDVLGLDREDEGLIVPEDTIDLEFITDLYDLNEFDRKKSYTYKGLSESYGILSYMINDDFWYEGIKIEVKASRAVDSESDDTLIMKALSSDSTKSFNMNFQQIKPGCCDVFVWIGVWKDVIRYWVLSSNEVAQDKYYSKGQHYGNEGEGQLWVKETNIEHFKQYEAKVPEILIKIKEKYRKQKGLADSGYTQMPDGALF